MTLAFQLSQLSKLDWVSIGIGLAVALMFYKPFFGGRPDGDDEHKSLLLDLVDCFASYGSIYDWSVLKMIVYLMLSVGSGFSAHYGLPRLFPNWFP